MSVPRVLPQGPTARSRLRSDSCRRRPHLDPEPEARRSADRLKETTPSHVSERKKGKEVKNGLKKKTVSAEALTHPIALPVTLVERQGTSTRKAECYLLEATKRFIASQSISLQSEICGERDPAQGENQQWRDRVDQRCEDLACQPPLRERRIGMIRRQMLFVRDRRRNKT